jgi:hypothetical protein
MKISKFVFESPYPIAINAKDSSVLYFEVDGRTLAADDRYGLEFIVEIHGFPTTYDDRVTLDLKCKINKIQKRLVCHALEQAILWLGDRFKEPQAIPIEELPKPQIVRAIELHREGG